LSDYQEWSVNVTSNETQYNLIVGVSGNGNTSPVPGTYPYGQYANASVLALPSTGNSFSYWLRNGSNVGSTNPYVQNMTSNYNLTAVFTADQYTLSVTVNGGGNVTSNPNQATYTYGTNVTLTAQPNAGWSFANWTGDASGTTLSVTINMTSNKTVTTTFVMEEYSLTINIIGNGSVSLNVTGLFHYGDAVKLTADADLGWSFSEWSGDLTGSVNPTTILMDENKTVTATFVEVPPSSNGYLVVRGTDSLIYYSDYDGSAWSNWALIPGATSYSPATAIYDGKLYIAVVGTMYNAIYCGSVNLTTLEFSGWTWIPGASDSAPTLASSTDWLYLVVRGTDSHIYYKAYDGSSWTGWYGLPGATQHTPTAAFFEGKLHIAIVGTMYNAIYWGSVNVTTQEFSGWTWIPGASDSAPTLASSADRLYLVVRGTDGIVYYRVYDGSVWSEWNWLPIETPYAPGATIFQGKLYVAVIGPMYNAIYYGSVNLTTLEFSGWTWILGASDSAPTLASPPE
jgi:hypothetical protein